MSDAYDEIMKDKAKTNDAEQGIVEIDRDNLDRECIRLPTQYLKYANLAADLKYRVDRLKAELDVTEADLAQKVRTSPASYGLEKLTEGALNEVILLQPEYRDKLRSLAKAKHEQELAQAVVWALEHKKKSLVMLVELAGLGWFSNPKMSERGRRALDDISRAKSRKFEED